MRRSSGLFAAAVWCCLASGLQAKELKELKVLYVGSERAETYLDFLKPYVARVEAAARDGFDPQRADGFDVVLLDWPQSGEARAMREGTSPLGERHAWDRPTVLLGSAGLNLAVAWQLLGGSGCTCLDPVAYDLREHRLFRHPYPIDLGRQVSVDTPESFRDELKASEITVLPLVDDADRTWRPGWCTYSTQFERHPDAEFFCGGVNAKTPTAAAIWRQGNLLHFGFEQSPAEMNDTGRHLLLNAIAYVSDFGEDRPIGIVPSVFAGPVARPRATVAKWLRNEDRAEWVEGVVAPDVWATLKSLETAEWRAVWAEERTPYFRPDGEELLTIDEDLQALGIGFDDPRFMDTMIAELRTGDTVRAERAARLLERYVPDGPKGGDAGRWERWWTENEPYAFASDLGRFRWYVDPLAKRRGVPSAELRGEARRDG